LPCLQIVEASSEILDLLNHQFGGLMRLSPPEGSQAVVSAFERPFINRIENRTAIFDDEGKVTQVLGFKVLARSAVARCGTGKENDSLVRGGVFPGKKQISYDPLAAISGVKGYLLLDPAFRVFLPPLDVR